MLARLIDMPAVPLPGDRDMPRVQGPDFGASERFVVAPGHEEDGIFEMPGGQSGNPLSPFDGAGFGAWARGEPAPFLPGPARGCPSPRARAAGAPVVASGFLSIRASWTRRPCASSVQAAE